LSIDPALQHGLEALATEFLNRRNATCQFAPKWDLASASPVHDFRIVNERNRIVGCAALWDQRGVKQAVVRAYSPVLRIARPLANLYSRLRGRPPLLPKIGQPLAHAFASHLATDEGRDDVLIALLQNLCTLARRRGLHFVTAGFAANDPRLRVVLDRFRPPRTYRSVLYVLHWSDGAALAKSIDLARPAAPEVALL
jgi:hypothetical protein